MAYDVETIGKFSENESWLVKLTGTEPGGTPALVGAFERVPDEMAASVKKEVDKYIVKNKSGKTSKRKDLLIGVVYESDLNQRDAATILLDETYAGSPCLLLVKGHNFVDLAAPKQQWWLFYGNVGINEEAMGSEENKVKFTFECIDNHVQIVVGAAGLADPTIGTALPVAGLTLDIGDMYHVEDA